MSTELGSGGERMECWSRWRGMSLVAFAKPQFLHPRRWPPKSAFVSKPNRDAAASALDVHPTIPILPQASQPALRRPPDVASSRLAAPVVYPGVREHRDHLPARGGREVAMAAVVRGGRVPLAHVVRCAAMLQAREAALELPQLDGERGVELRLHDAH